MDNGITFGSGTAGFVSESRLDESVRRLLLVEFQRGLFDDPFVHEDYVEEIVGNAASALLADVGVEDSVAAEVVRGERDPEGKLPFELSRTGGWPRWSR